MGESMFAAAGVTTFLRGLQGAKEFVDPADVSTNVHNGRMFSHWSQYILAGGVAIGLITAVAGYALEQMPLVVVSGVLVITCAVGVYYLKKFIPLRSLEAGHRCSGR